MRNYKFTGKERDAESGLDNFGARFDASSLGRFMTPDWAAKPTAVPYAHYGNPQSLNLYSYVNNNPTTTGDRDGHCPGDQTACDKVKVHVEQADSPQQKNNAPMGGKDKKTGEEKPPFHTGVAGVNKITFKTDGKAMTDMPVTEKNSIDKGTAETPTENTQAKKTDAKGEIFDVVGVGVTSQQKLSSSDTQEIQEQVATPHKEVTTQTLTFQTDGQTCTCTYTRTLSIASGTYKVDIPNPDPPVKPAN